MTTKLTIATIAMFAVIMGIGAITPAMSAKPDTNPGHDRIDICHFDEDTGDYVQLHLPRKAAEKHLANHHKNNDVPDDIALGEGETCPSFLADSDGDGISDAEELAIGTDPNLADTDADGVNDGDEIAQGTDPLSNVDSDGDTLSDDLEVQLGTDPALLDTDSDGLNDNVELVPPSTDPTNPDTDGDGIVDGDDADPLDPTVQ